MKAKITKRLFLLVFCFALVIAVFPSSSFDVSADAVMSTITVNWANPQQLRSIDKQTNQAVLTANINGTATQMYLSFPTEGGMRFRTDISGYFEPESLKEISYYDLGNGVMLLQAGDISVKLD